jgi:hypothetical protein
MTTNNMNKSGAASRFLDRLFAERKKLVTAICLIAMMVFMWAKVFLKSGAAGAQAGVGDQATKAERVGRELNVSYVELPTVVGRNDSITRDSFDSQQWMEFGKARQANQPGGAEEVNAVSPDGMEDVAARIVAQFQLQAVWVGKTPQASINNKLVLVGDKLQGQYGSQTLECEVTRIEEDRVFLGCSGNQVELRLDRGIKKKK